MVKEQIREILKKEVKETFGISLDIAHLEHPSNETWGDYYTNCCLTIAKQLKQSPIELAKNLCYRFGEYIRDTSQRKNEYKLFDSVEFAPPGFINFKLSDEWLQKCLQEVIVGDESYGSFNQGAGNTILIEFSQPNPNKPMHVGHARNNFLGSSLSKVFRFLNYKVIEANYMNNWGTHVVKSMLMYQKYGDGREPDKKPDHFVGDFYTMYELKSEEDPALGMDLAEMFRNLEKGDEKTTELWKKIVGWVYKGWEETYRDEGISFDLWQYQSDYVSSGKEIAELAVRKGIAERDESGAIVARLEKYGIPDKVLLRSDGTSIYSTQDLELARDSFEKYKLSKRLYVVDYRQADYFRQIFKILEILGFKWAENLHHVSYGTVELPEGHMSSRKGLVVTADEVLQKLIELEKEEISKRSEKAEPEEGSTARKVALAAYKYGMLKVDSKQNIVFDYSHVTKFEGDTGPYLLYTYARCRSILAKMANPRDFKRLNLEEMKEEEIKLLRFLPRFPEVVLEAADTLSPSVICNYLFELGQRFNSFYNAVSVISESDEDLRNFRLNLVEASSTVLRNGLSLLGIEAPERM